jgi:hypothetical protein
MDADWSVELGADDGALEFPWSSSDGSQRYLDLQRRPGLLDEIPEATEYHELAEFLGAINIARSPWLTVKCDVWSDLYLSDAEAIYDATVKLCSYVDLIARDSAARFSFERHEQWVKSAARKLSAGDDLPIACEFIVRRCWYHSDASSGQDTPATATSESDPTPGFYVTFYLSGYGNDELEARTRWAAGLRHATSPLTGLAP